MDTSWKNWALTMGSALVAGLLATGHGQVVATAGGHVVDAVLLVIAPLGPR